MNILPSEDTVFNRLYEKQSVLSRVPEEKIKVIKNTIAKGATNDELELFLYICGRYNLDPFLKEIYFFKSSGKQDNVISRDGYLKVAMTSPMYDGMQSQVVREGDAFEINTHMYEVKHKFGAKRGAILGAWAKVEHKQRKPVIVYVDFKEYRRRGHKAWDKYPSAMIQKVAEVFALRRQFNIAGVVAREEIDFPGDRTQMQIPSPTDYELEQRNAGFLEENNILGIIDNQKTEAENSILDEIEVDKVVDADFKKRKEFKEEEEMRERVEKRIEERDEKEEKKEEETKEEVKEPEEPKEEPKEEKKPTDLRDLDLTKVESLDKLLQASGKDVEPNNPELLLGLAQTLLKKRKISSAEFLNLKKEIQGLEPVSD